MSYSVDWIDSVFDREYNDVLRVELNPATIENKGAYNAEDLNRIENNTKYCAEYMLDIGIITAEVTQSYKTDWNSNDIVTRENMTRIISNITRLMDLSNPKIKKDFATVTLSAQMNYILANALEKNLDIMHTQPPYIPDEYVLTINNGIIYGQENPAYVIEDDTVNIIGYPYGPSAEYMTFEHWSGNTDDLQYVGDVNSQNTTYTMPDHDVELTAEFKINIPFQLTLTNATINDETGGTSRWVVAGTTIDIIEDVAPVGKRFYCWEGTEEALELLSSGIYASTNTLTMPEMNVELHPKYINAGQHKVIITDTDGRTIISEETYEYGDYVSIFAPSKGRKWEFASWSGDTSYLTDITSSIQSFNMGDVDLRFTPSYNYVYGYHDVATDHNCLVNGEDSLEDVRELSLVQLSLTSAYEATLNNDNWFDAYIVNYTDENDDPVSYEIQTQNTTMQMPDSDTTITVRSNTPSILNVENLNNSGQTTIYKGLGGRYVELNTNSVVGQYVFVGWYKGNVCVSNKTYVKYEYSYLIAEDTITAVYEYRDYHTVTVINRNNTGGTETHQVLEGFEITINTQEIVGTDIIDEWLFNDSGLNPLHGDTSWTAKVYHDLTIEIVYRARETYTITIENGTIQDYGSSYTGLERSTITIVADIPATKKYFDRWSTTSGGVHKYGRSIDSTTILIVGRSNATVTATYGDLYDLTINTNDGIALQGQYKNNSEIQMPSSTLPNSDAEWDKWNLVSGKMSILNIFLMRTKAYTGDADTVVNATYKNIPYFELYTRNGKFEDGSTYQYVQRNSNVLIQMNPAPAGQAFLMWEVYSGSANIEQPRAETTYISNVIANATVEAVYYTPDDTVKYTLSITNKNGATSITSHVMGDIVNIYADYPDDGYEFYRWAGDVAYIGDRYSAETNVLIPGKNIQLYMVYRRSGYTTLYDVVLNGGKMLVGMNGQTEIWESDGQFEEGAIVQIKADTIPSGYKFNGWRNSIDDGASMSTVNDLMATQTYLTVSTFDIELTRDIILQDQYSLTIKHGEVAGAYYENVPVPIYFSLQNTDKVRYTFSNWTGDTNLELFTGGSFDVNDDGGKGDTPQTIKMPARNIELVANYTTEYKVNLTNAEFTDESNSKWLEEDDEVTITANEIEGKTFSHWEASVNGAVSNLYNPTTNVITPNKNLNIVAVYTNANGANGVGYVLTSLYENDTIDTEDIVVISGEIAEGFLISDNVGHLYIVTNVTNDTANILRLTQKWEVE